MFLIRSRELFKVVGSKTYLNGFENAQLMIKLVNFRCNIQSLGLKNRQSMLLVAEANDQNSCKIEGFIW